MIWYWHDFRMEAAVAEKPGTGLWQYQTFTSSGRHGPLFWTASYALLYARETPFFFFPAYCAGLFGGATSVVRCHVSIFGMADWRDWIRRPRAFIIYTLFLIKKKKCEKNNQNHRLSSASTRSRSRITVAAGRGSTRWIQNHWDIAKPAALFHFHAET